jgi:hypothetical protein
MSQNDYTIANQTTPLFRADLNNALQALASNSSGPTAPATTYANMTWYDTGTNTLYMRSEADDAWIALGTLNQSTNTFTPAGSLTLASQAEAEAGTDNTKVMTPLRVEQAISVPNSDAIKSAMNVSGAAPVVAPRARGFVSGGSLVAGVNVAAYNTTTGVVTFITAMPDSNYTVAGQGSSRGGTEIGSKTTTSFQVSAYSSGGNLISRATLIFDFVVLG